MSLVDTILSAVKPDGKKHPAIEKMKAKLTAAQAELEKLTEAHGPLVLAADQGGSATAADVEKSRAAIEAKQAHIADIQAALVALDALAETQAAEARAKERARLEAEGRAALEAVKAAAVTVDGAIDALGTALAEFEDAAIRLRPYASDEGNSAMAKAASALPNCLNYRLRGLPGFYGDPALTKDHLATWAQHVPDTTEAPRLLAKFDERA